MATSSTFSSSPCVDIEAIERLAAWSSQDARPALVSQPAWLKGLVGRAGQGSADWFQRPAVSRLSLAADSVLRHKHEPRFSAHQRSASFRHGPTTATIGGKQVHEIRLKIHHGGSASAAGLRWSCFGSARSRSSFSTHAVRPSRRGRSTFSSHGENHRSLGAGRHAPPCCSCRKLYGAPTAAWSGSDAWVSGSRNEAPPNSDPGKMVSVRFVSTSAIFMPRRRPHAPPRPPATRSPQEQSSVCGTDRTASDNVAAQVGCFNTSRMEKASDKTALHLFPSHVNFA